MATTVAKFVAACEEIVRAKPEYKLGKSDKKQCDCIGMVKYGLRRCGVDFSTSGTNWTFRHQVRDIRKITSESVLRVGDVVFKVRTPGSEGYNLPDKYCKGGKAYNVDLNDYCHIGVVKSVNPLRIIHMTSPTAKTDTKIGKWAYTAELDPQYVNYGSSAAPSKPAESKPEPVPEPNESSDTAIVTAEHGDWVKMRKEPSTKCRLYDEVPVGAKVTVVTNGYEWTKINYGKRKGWFIMTKFLKKG